MSSEGAAREIKRTLTDPAKVLTALGFLGDRRSFARQAGGYLVRCPVHSEKTPSCSVQRKSGILLFKCHGCDATGDVLDLVAAVRGRSLATEFIQVLIEAAELGGMHTLVRELEMDERRDHEPPAKQGRISATMPQDASAEPERPYPPPDELKAFLEACTGVTEDPEVESWLRGRGLDPDAIEGSETAYALPIGTKVRRWASFQGRAWTRTGHRLIVPVYDANGFLRSVRAGRVIDGDSPKRLPPGGFRASGLVMACQLAVSMLRGTWIPERVVISEGETDWLAFVSARGLLPCARIGITSGSWSQELADRIPNGAIVIIRTDNDPAGDKYAAAIISSLRSRCDIRRKEPIYENG